VKNLARNELIDVAMGRSPPDVLIKGGKLVNVCTGEIHAEDIALKGDRIAYLGDAEKLKIDSHTKVIDARGKYITPGLIDPHIHLYHTQLNMTQIARVLLPHGTTAVADGFYAIGIVSGIRGIRFCLEEIKRTPLKIIFLVPALAYYQNRDLELQASPNAPTFDDMRVMLDWPECKGIEEPPYTPITNKDPNLIALFEKALGEGKVITGHACGISQGGLNAYLAMGADSDHECGSAEEALQKARVGMRIAMREGSAASNITQVVKALTEYKIDSRYFSFSADVLSAVRAVKKGHLDECIRLAISKGLNPVTAVQLATINAAELLKVDGELGSIAPGKIADVLLVDDLPTFKISLVIANGEIVVKNGEFLAELRSPSYPDFMYNTVRLKRPLNPKDFEIKAPETKETVTVRVIGARDGTLVTEDLKVTLKVENGVVKQDLGKDVLKIAMIDRFHLSGKVGKGFVHGFGLMRGAIGSTYTPITENIIIVGATDEDMCLAANELAEVGGGMIAVQEGKVRALLELPLCGLLSDGTAEAVIEKQSRLYEAVKQMGCKLADPFHTLAFLGACPEIGTLKICEEGLLNVLERRLENLILE